MKRLFLLILISLGLVTAAQADTCGTSLMPSFTANQATQLCKIFGSAVNHSLIPSADNTYDVGSSTYGWRTGYFDTSVITPLLAPTTSQIVQVRSDANRLFTLDGSSDTALTFTFGDAGTTATQTFTLSSSTADADDDSTAVFAGGGAVGTAGSRGAYLSVEGNEVSGGGDIKLVSGAASGSEIEFAPANTGVAKIDASGYASTSAAISADLTGITTTAPRIINVMASNGGGTAAQLGVNSASGPRYDYLKSRATDTSADVIVNSGDDLGALTFWGANGTTYDPAAQIVAQVGGTPGASADMPGSLIFRTSPDGSATLAAVLTLAQDKSATFTGALTSTATGSLGWSYVTGANTACTSTCTNAAVFGVDLAAGATAPVIVGATDANADACVCAGSS